MGEAKVAHFVSDHVVDTVDGRLDELRVEENATVGITAPPATPHLSQTDIWLWDVVPPDDFVTSLKSSREREPRVLSKPIARVSLRRPYSFHQPFNVCADLNRPHVGVFRQLLDEPLANWFAETVGFPAEFQIAPIKLEFLFKVSLDVISLLSG